MFKLLTNYIREQKTSLIQVFGLGFVIIIMISSFLSLNFATNYISDQYFNDIAQGEFHQDVKFFLDSNFRSGYIQDSWLDNLNYVTKEDEIVEEKMLDATFQIDKLKEDTNEGLHIYRFYFESDETNSSTEHVHIARKFAQETNHKYLDFKLSAPLDYPSIAEHKEYLNEQAKLIDNYVYINHANNDETKEENQTNFFITNKNALTYYQENIQPQNNWAKRDYTEDDIKSQTLLYQLIIMGMLYGDNLKWERSFYINDLLITGKVVTFIQTSPDDKVNAPILVSGQKYSFDPRDLKDDEILIYREFAQENNLKIGQDYIFAGYKFHIIGFATSAIATNNASYFFYQSNNKNQTVAFANQNTINKVSANPYAQGYEGDFLGFNPEIASKHIYDAPNPDDSINNEWIYQYFHKKLLNDNRVNKSKLYFIKNGIHNRLLFSPLNDKNLLKVQTIEGVVWTNVNELKGIFLEIASGFLGLIFVVVSIIIFIVVFKMIDRNKRLIGILKAHGYQNYKLNLALVISTLFPIAFFAVLGAALAIVFGHLIVTTYSTAIILINYGWPFYYQTALIVIIVPVVALGIVSYLLVAFLLRVNALTLINNSWTRNNYNVKINAFFALMVTKITKNFNYYNKLALTTTFRGFGKMLFVAIVSIFASTLLLFSFSSSGLVNNLLGLQFASIKYNYSSQYNFDGSTVNNFINDNDKLLYKKENIQEIKSHASLYQPIKQAVAATIEELQADKPVTPKVIDFRYGYIMGSELFQVRQVIDSNIEQFPEDFQAFWKNNEYFIDYLTNDNGANPRDLMINFGLLPYEEGLENDYTQLNFYQAFAFDINMIDTTEYYYDNENDILTGDWNKYRTHERTVNGVNSAANNFLNPGLRNSNFNQFGNLTLSKMIDDGGWLNNNFINIRDAIIKKFNVKDPDTAAVKIIPMIGSTIPGLDINSGGDGNNIGKTVLYRYTGLDFQTKYIIGVVYDGARNLLQDTVLMPQAWLNQAIFGPDTNLASQFANAKFTNFVDSELHQYLPIISSNNDYQIDITKIADMSYIQHKGVTPGLNMIYDVNAIKEMLQARQYSLQVLIFLFAVFSVILSFMIIVIISNINIRDNLVLIDILRSLGYSAPEISYVFLMTTIPVLIIFSLFSIFIAPILTGFIAGVLGNFLSMTVPIIFEWWYFALALLTVILIYFVSYLITWSLNVNKKQLIGLTR